MNLLSLAAEPRSVEPGERAVVEFQPDCVFRAQKLALVGMMEPIRGRFWIKRSRRGWLDRDCVVAHSVYRKTPSRRRTAVEYRDPTGKRSFRCEYRPENVVYRPVDPLEYVVLRQVRVGGAPMMPDTRGVRGDFFAAGVLGNGLPFATSRSAVELHLENQGDVCVTVYAMLFGIGR